MNETLWFTGTDPLALLSALHPMHSHGSEPPQTRASRMYLLACARRQWDRLPGVCRALVALAEVFADNPRGENRLRREAAPVAERLMHCEGKPGDLLDAETELAALAVGERALPGDLRTHLRGDPPPAPVPKPDEWRGLAALVYLPFEGTTPAYHWVPAPLHSVELLREVYGNPCRRVAFDPDWRTDTVVGLARQMYDSRDFGAMPILADALQDAGCDNEQILAHCRKPGEHVRGCWVVDLVLRLH